ncbi:MAG: hypothetical protein K8U57_27610 [Planctomycetes bacterium]|nr:hypothetical protein [Planctomycetota bacterium]
MYNASITFKASSEQEYGYDEKLPTLQDAIEWIESYAAGSGDMCLARINGKPVRIKSCRVVDEHGEPLCPNEKWHEIFASPAQKIEPLQGSGLLAQVHAQMDRIFAPQPTRGSSPTNPATLIATGKVDL